MELTPAKIAQQYRLQQWIETIRDCKTTGFEKFVNPCAKLLLSLPSNTNETTLIPVPSSIRTPSFPSKANDEQAAIILCTDAVIIEIHSHASVPLIEQMLRYLHDVR